VKVYITASSPSVYPLHHRIPFPLLDLTPTSCLAGICSHHRRHRLPGREPATSATLRTPPALHASQNPCATFLNTSAVDPQPRWTPDDLGKLPPSETLARAVPHACMRWPARTTALRRRWPSNRTVERTPYPFGRRRASWRASWAGSGPDLARPARSGLFHFFSLRFF
jgi:hypothetical protein